MCNDKEILNHKILKFKGNKLDTVSVDRNFEEYIFVDNIQDFLLRNYNFNVRVFKSVKMEENKMLFNFYKSKKDDFQTQITTYLNDKNLNFVNQLTSRIISNEDGTDIMKQKIKIEIKK